LVGADGPTHHGTLDLTYLRCVPGLVVTAPKDGNELKDLLWTALSQDERPFAIRFPRDTVPDGYDPSRTPRALPLGSWERLHEGRDATLVATGTMVRIALDARALLASEGVDAGVVNARFVKPLDLEMLERLVSAPLLVTLEENTVAGGFGSGVADALAGLGRHASGLLAVGLPDMFVTHGTRAELLAELGLDAAGVARRVLAARRTR